MFLSKNQNVIKEVPPKNGVLCLPSLKIINVERDEWYKFRNDTAVVNMTDNRGREITNVTPMTDASSIIIRFDRDKINAYANAINFYVRAAVTQYYKYKVRGIKSDKSIVALHTRNNTSSGVQTDSYQEDLKTLLNTYDYLVIDIIKVGTSSLNVYDYCCIAFGTYYY